MVLKYLLYFVFITTLLLNLKSEVSANPTTLSTEESTVQKNIDWKKDIEYIKTELPKLHKDLFFKLSKEEFETELNKLSAKVEKMNSFQIAVNLHQIMVKIGDSHTGFWYEGFFDEKNKLPFKVYWFSDGLYILETNAKHKKILGSKIISINEFPIDKVNESFKTLVVQDNQAINKMFVPDIINNKQLLEYFSFVSQNKKINLKLQDTNGKIFIESFEPYEIFSLEEKYNKEKFFTLKDKETIFWDKYVEDDGIYFIQYNKCWSREAQEKKGHLRASKKKPEDYPSLVEFIKQVLKTVDEKPISKFVFDMRFNPGGNSEQGTFFVKKLKNLDKVNKKGTLFVLIGRDTFSSAIINAIDFKDQTNVIFVGEETSGMPNHFGEVRPLKLPSSGLIISYSTKYFKISDLYTNTITPDIEIKYNFKDFSMGKDPAYEAIKNYNQ